MLGGTANYSITKTNPISGNTTTTKSFSLQPLILFATSNENIALGFSVGYKAGKYYYSTPTTSSQEYVSENINYLWELGFVSRFNGKLTDKFSGIADAKIAAGYGKVAYDYLGFYSGSFYMFDHKSKLMEYSFTFSPGIAYNIKKKVQLTLNYGLIGIIYTREKTIPEYWARETKNNATSFGLNLNSETLRIGAYFRF